MLKSGVLKKLGGGDGGHKNWKDRYFVLTDHLAYYKDWEAFQRKGEPLGTVTLNSYFAAPVEGSTNFEFAVHAYPKSLVCRALSVSDMEEWIEVRRPLLVPLVCVLWVGWRLNRTCGKQECGCAALVALTGRRASVVDGTCQS